MSNPDNDSGNDSGSHPTGNSVAGTTRRGGCAKRNLVMLGLFAAALVVVGIMLAEGQPADDGRAATLILQPDELAAVTGGAPTDYRRSSPPIDIGTAERAARAATMGKVPSPNSRHLDTRRNVTTGAEVTQAVILFDDAQAAADLASAARPLLGSTFGLMAEPVALDDVDEAVLWSNSRYRAVTFRHGGVIVLVGTTDTASSEALDGWAQRVRDKVVAAAEAPPLSPTP